MTQFGQLRPTLLEQVAPPGSSTAIRLMAQRQEAAYQLQLATSGPSNTQRQTDAEPGLSPGMAQGNAFGSSY